MKIERNVYSGHKDKNDIDDYWQKITQKIFLQFAICGTKCTKTFKNIPEKKLKTFRVTLCCLCSHDIFLAVFFQHLNQNLTT